MAFSGAMGAGHVLTAQNRIKAENEVNRSTSIKELFK